jgi:hypothetical protein
MPVGVEQWRVHCSEANRAPMTTPHAPPTTMARKANALARADGNAESGRDDTRSS